MMEASQHEKASVESLVARVADDFQERQKNGELPDIEEYAARYPEAADLLRKVLAALELIGPAQLSGSGLAEMTTEPVGTLGDFRIVREVGRGGMGVVYEAEQISLHRRVALKVLPFAATMDPRQLQRFHNEARAAACLDHPHIVKVHAVGCERGVHYFAMKFIDGQSLAELIAAQRHEATSGGRQLPDGRSDQGADAPRSPRAATQPVATITTQASPRNAAHYRRIAEWGIQAAEALEHAHGLGIIHRDIKPANLMIDAQGLLWITDFGLARTTTDAGLTMTGDILGTLRYMSPEQALAKYGLVDHRTDVYSLGLTLYEMVSGTPAIEGNDREEILNAITRDEPRPLRTLVPAIPHDLETIVLKAMAKEPAERYATARELADDLRRFLMHEPIRAKRTNLFQRSRKWAYRHKSAVEVAALVLVLVMIGLVIGTYLLWQKEAETRTALELVEKQRSVALANEKRANAVRHQAELYLDRSFNDMWYLLKELDKKEFADMPGIDRMRQKLTAYALKQYETYLREQSPDPEVRHWTARAYQAMGVIQRNPRKAVEALAKSVTISEALTKEFPEDARYWVRLGHHRWVLAESLADQDRRAQAIEQYRQAIDAFETATRLAPDDHRAVSQLASHLMVIDDTAIRNPARAVVLARRAVELAPNYCEVWDMLGVVCYHAGIWGEAITALEKGFALLEEKNSPAYPIIHIPSEHPDKAKSKCYLSIAYSRFGNVEKARVWYDKVVRWMDKNEPQDRELRHLRAEAAELLGIRQQPPVQDTQASPRR